MIEHINNFVLSNVNNFARVLATLTIIIVGTPFISFEGGIPRLNGVITNKPASIVLAVLLGLVTLFVVEPLFESLYNTLITKFTDYTLEALLISSGMGLWQWDKKMRWSYKYYWLSAILLGFTLVLLEVFEKI